MTLEEVKALLEDKLQDTSLSDETRKFIKFLLDLINRKLGG